MEDSEELDIKNGKHGSRFRLLVGNILWEDFCEVCTHNPPIERVVDR